MQSIFYLPDISVIIAANTIASFSSTFYNITLAGGNLVFDSVAGGLICGSKRRTIDLDSGGLFHLVRLQDCGDLVFDSAAKDTTILL